MSNPPGVLYVVATPIGNLGDLGERARRTLAAVDWIAAEDTRHTRRLLTHFDIHTPLYSLHAHNEAQRLPQLLERLRAGEHGALVSDAGTPLIRDPGYLLVREAARAGMQVRAVPGPCALVAALSVAGLPADRFRFEGFLPARRAARRQRLQGLAATPVTLVFYESAHRIVESLEDLVAVFGGERPVALARELTKRHETVLRGAAASVLARLREDPEQRLGEFVVVVGAAPDPADDEEVPEPVRRLLRLALDELPPRRAAALAAGFSGLPRNRLYHLALRLREGGEPPG